MARENELYENLLHTEFQFMVRGRHQMTTIYNAVKLKLPDLCDDNYLCSECCKMGTNQPEWNHRVRAALNFLKGKSGISKDPKHGHWIFV